MEESLVAFFLQRLNYLLLKEIQVFSGLEDQIQPLITKLSYLKSQIQLFKSRLNEIGYFTNDAASSLITEENNFIQNWLRSLRESIHNSEDCIDQFIINMNNKDGSEQAMVVAVFRSELLMINECLAEILDRKSKLENSIISIEVTMKSYSSAVVDEAETSFAFKFNALPFYLKSSLIYCAIFNKNYNYGMRTRKEVLIKLLVAEGLIQEISGEVMENTADENINKLIDMGMIEVSKEDEKPEWNYCSVPSQYFHRVVTGDEFFYISNTNSDADIPLDIRRVRIQAIDEDKFLANLNKLHTPIRSLFVMRSLSFNCHLNSWETLLCRLKFLRVLDLSYIKFNSSSLEDVGNLIHLRYLGLTWSDLDELPKSLGCLRNLQTLDIRWSFKIKTLPSEILNLTQLRHLQMETRRFNNNIGVLVPSGIGKLSNLQTLIGLYGGVGIANEISNLTQLKTLGIQSLSEEHASDLVASIMKMTGLLSLSIEPVISYNFQEDLLPSLELFSPPPLLRDLHLVGCLEEMPNWLSSMENLTDLSLSNSYLFEIQTSAIQFLPNLKRLKLRNVFEAKHIGREFCSPGGFPSLEVLLICSKSLVEWPELDKGALQSLKVLIFYSCYELRTLPEGLQSITTLQKLELNPLHGDLARRLSPNGGKENYKIKHIPVVKASKKTNDIYTFL